MKINNARDAIHQDLVRTRDPAGREAEADDPSFDDIDSSVQHFEIIEDYQDDRPYPRCMRFGMASSGDRVRSVSTCDDRRPVSQGGS